MDAIGNTIYASSVGSSTIHTSCLENGSFQEWETSQTSISSINCLFSDSKNSCLYVCASDGGGQDQIFEFHPEVEKSTDSFTEVATINPLPNEGNSLPRTFPTSSLAASQTHIYLVQNNARDASCVTANDLRQKLWLEKRTLPFSCWDSSCVCIDDTLYVLGSGIKPTEEHVSNLVSLSLNEPKCRTCLPSVDRKFARLAVDKENHLIAVGGREYEGASTAASLLDWLENKWLQLPDMISGHYRHGVCVTGDNSLAVIGGYANNTTEFLTVPDKMLSHNCG